MALFEYSLSSIDMDDEMYNESVGDFVSRVFESIIHVIDNVIDSFNLLIKKRASSEDLKETDFHTSRMNAIGDKLYRDAKTTLDKGLIIINKIVDGGTVSDETVDEYITSTRKKIEEYSKKHPIDKSITNNIARDIGYQRMSKLLYDSKERIREDSRKLYNKNTEMEKKSRRRFLRVSRELKDFISAMGKI